MSTKTGECTTDCPKNGDGKWTLYMAHFSAPARSVMQLFEELGVSRNDVVVDFAKGDNTTKDYLEKNPNHTVPLAVSPCGSFSLWESGAILQYVADSYQGANDHWFPTDRRKRAVVNQWLDFRNGTLFPLLINTVAMKLAPPSFTYKDESTRNAVYSENLPKFEDRVKTLETQLAKTTYVAGAEISIADIAIWQHLITPLAIGLNVFDGRYPNVKRWGALVSARPATVRTNEPYEKIKAARVAATAAAAQEKKSA